MTDNESDVHQSAPWWRPDPVLVGILVAGALLRGAYLLELRGSPEVPMPAFDAAFHDYWARALLSGDWSPPRFFPDPELATTPYFRPPLYPYFLAGLYALTGSSPLGARALQMVLGLVNIVLGFRVGRTMFGHTAARFVAAGLACSWPVLYFEGELLAPPLLITLVLGETLALQRWWQRGGWATAIVAGVLLGLFALALPNALSLVPVVWLWQWWVARRRRQRGGLSAALLGLPLGLVLTIAPATIRNAVVAGDFVPITANGGVNLYIGNNPEADGCTARIPILAELAPLQGWTCFDQPAIARGVERLAGRRLRASEVSTFFADKALAYAAEHPAATLALAARKAALFWGPIEVANNRELEIARAESTTLRWLPGFPWLLSLALVGAAWLVCARRAAGEPARAFALLLGAATLVFFATHLPFFVAGRYRLPLYPFLLLFGACGVHGVLGLVRERRRGAAALWTGSWLALLVLAHVPLTDYRPDRSAWHFQLGGAWRMAGQPERAAAEYRLALAAAARPFPVASNNLGAVLLQLGETAAGIEQLRLALRHAPDYAEARYNLALALASGGRDDLAAVEFEHALRVTPDDAVTHVALAASLLRLRRPAEALGHVGHAMQHGDRAPRTRCLYAIALLEMGRSQEAVAELQSVRREHPGFVNAYLLLVDAAMQQGDRGRAREIVEQGLRAVPGHPGLEAWRERLR